MQLILSNTYVKENAQFDFLSDPQKSGASWVSIIFLQIAQKIPTKDINHWMELITGTLPFLQIFSVRKTTTQLIQYFRKSARKSINKLYFWHILDLQKQITDNSCGYLHSLFLPDSDKCFFIYMFSTIHPYLSLLFYHFVLLFSPSFSYSSRHETHSTIYNVWLNFITLHIPRRKKECRVNCNRNKYCYIIIFGTKYEIFLPSYFLFSFWSGQIIV